MSLAVVPVLAATPGVADAGSSVSPITDISSACSGSNAEVKEATAPPDYVYALWMGCGGIGFASSADGGRTFSPPVTVPDSTGPAGSSWDPAVVVARNGTVYLSFMHISGFSTPPPTMYPVVVASFDHGKSFGQVTPVMPPASGNWGDREFIAVRPTGRLYLTWDYGPSAAEIKLDCSSGGSCAFTGGDFNAVIQTSDDGGRTWGPITPVEPGFPLGGGNWAPLVVRPDGQIDVLYMSHATDPQTLAISSGYEYFTSSRDGTHWAPPRRIWPDKGTLALSEWWIDGDIAADAAGNLYATWDTQTAAGDIGWLTWSTDSGRTWSRPVRVTPDTDNAPHIVQVAGGQPGVAYVGWQTSAPAAGYATYLRPYAIGKGWLGPAIQVSSQYGNASIWPGDTFGISVLPGRPNRISLTWGSATGTSQDSEIYAADVTLPLHP
jgi:hypothetical protein